MGTQKRGTHPPGPVGEAFGSRGFFFPAGPETPGIQQGGAGRRIFFGGREKENPRKNGRGPGGVWWRGNGGKKILPAGAGRWWVRKRSRRRNPKAPGQRMGGRAPDASGKTPGGQGGEDTSPKTGEEGDWARRTPINRKTPGFFWGGDAPGRRRGGHPMIFREGSRARGQPRNGVSPWLGVENFFPGGD